MMASFTNTCHSLFQINLILLSLLLLLLFNSGPSLAVKCYQCSGTNPNCGNPFYPEDPAMSTCTGKQCVSIISPSRGMPGTFGWRFCSQHPLMFPRRDCESGPDGSKVCSCNETSFCNNEDERTGKGRNWVAGPDEFKCYECSGEDCDKPLAEQATCYGTSCISMTFNPDGQILRGCNSGYFEETGCKMTPFLMSNVFLCNCHGHLCNGGRSGSNIIGSSSLLLFLGGLLALSPLVVWW